MGYVTILSNSIRLLIVLLPCEQVNSVTQLPRRNGKEAKEAVSLSLLSGKFHSVALVTFLLQLLLVLLLPVVVIAVSLLQGHNDVPQHTLILLG